MTLPELNNLPQSQFRKEILKCCGSTKWVDRMVKELPFDSEQELLSKADSIWLKCLKNDWLEAFSHHPKIGDLKSFEEKYVNTSKWAKQEQAGLSTTNKEIVQQFAELNQRYEKRFGFIFIVFATGKSALEMKELLEKRINNNPDDEIKIAAVEQNKIIKLRIQ